MNRFKNPYLSIPKGPRESLIPERFWQLIDRDYLPTIWIEFAPSRWRVSAYDSGDISPFAILFLTPDDAAELFHFLERIHYSAQMGGEHTVGWEFDGVLLEELRRRDMIESVP